MCRNHSSSILSVLLSGICLFGLSPTTAIGVPISDIATVGLLATFASANVDLELRAKSSIVPVNETIEVDLFAVSDDGNNQSFSGLDVVLTWDATSFALEEVVGGEPHGWFLFGLLPDSALDGLNDSLTDGDAFFQAAAFSSASATPEGFHVATLRFSALAETPPSQVVIESELGNFSHTQVLAPGAVNVTGGLGVTAVSVGVATLRVVDLTVPADRTVEALIRGRVSGLSTFGLTILLEIVPREGNSGVVIFTSEPSTDISQRGDPWPGAGSFSAFDTDSPGFSETLNATVDDDGVFLDSPLVFDGALSAFPVRTSADAAGVWDIVLATSEGNSFWESLDTSLEHATLRIVDLGDGDGDVAIDVRDFAELQVCYTGAVAAGSQPAYSITPERRCVVYDFDGDGDIDDFDYGQFSDVMSGPAR